MKNIFSTHYYDTSKIMHSNKLEGLELAGFNRRFFAFFFDLFALVVVLYVIGTILNFFGLINFGLRIGIGSDNTTNSLPNINNGIHLDVPEYVTTIFKLLIPVIYFGLITYFTNGYTAGKRIFMIRIVATNHKRLTLWHSIERSLGYYASSLEFGFGFLQYFVDYNRRTVHDRIAETIVIKVKKLKKKRNYESSNHITDEAK